MKNIIIISSFLFCFHLSVFSQTQAEMNEAALKKYEQADLELNKVYKQVITILNPGEKKLMVKAQKDWLKFRDSNCAFEAEEFNGGSMQPLIRISCLEETTKERIKSLKSVLKRRK